jgi:hypothetical protein
MASEYMTKIETQLGSSWEQLDSLKAQLYLAPETNEQKRHNKQLQEQIKRQQKTVDQLQKTYQAEQASWTSRNPEEPAAPTAESVIEVSDVSRQRVEGEYGLTGFEDPEIKRIEGQVDADMTSARQDLEALRQLGDQLISGYIPADVSEAVRMSAGASALSRGLTATSQMARNLTARDLGLTSMDLQSRGAELLGATASASQASAAFEASRSQYRTQYQLATAEFQDAVRKTDLTVAQLNEEKRQFRQKMILALNEQIIDLAKFREELNFKFSATKLEGDANKASGPLSTIDNLFPQIRNSLRV